MKDIAAILSAATILVGGILLTIAMYAIPFVAALWFANRMGWT